MVDLFTYDFVIRALIAGSVTGITAALVGNFVVAARQSVMSDMLAHTALAGVGLGIFLQFSPTFLAFFISLITSVLLWYMLRDRRNAPDAIAMLLLSGGLAIALLFAHIAKNNPISFETFLFGSLLTISVAEMIWFVAVNVVICGIVIILRRQLVVVVFDPIFAHTQTRYTRVFELIFMIMIGAIVAIGLKIIGGLLIGALFIIPVLTAQSIANSFQKSVYISMICGLIGVWSGIIASFYFDIPTSSGIVFSLLILFFLSRIARHWINRS
jgi:zinc transport system permease protein